MKVKFDFNLQAWMQDLVIEADSLDEARQKLADMDVDAIVREGYVHSSTIDDLDMEIIERDIKVTVYSVDYDIDEADFEANGIDPTDEEACERFRDSLPQEFKFTLTNVERGNEDDAISNEISNKTGWLVNSHNSEFQDIL